ncbi:MAG TPA: hypothetical protein VKA34_06585 [Balneolales bacterium]|nr:hypothetical protein [Balneolales bacterium]
MPKSCFIHKKFLLFIFLLGFAVPSWAQVIHTESPQNRRMITAKQLMYTYIFPNRNFHPEEQIDSTNVKDSFFNKLSRKPGIPFLSSALVPGLGQAENHQWVKMGIFVGIEAAALVYHFHMYHQAQNLERDYHYYADHNWSLVKYARFLIDYHNAYYPNDPISYNSLAKNGQQLGNSSADTRIDWNRVSIDAIRQLEKKTLYGGTTGDAFSHSLPDLGSQQYYELMSKYYQFGPGWKDFQTPPKSVNWSPDGMSPDWHLGAKRAAAFNNHYRTAEKMMMVVIINHFVSAFDAFFTSKIRNEHLEASTYYISNSNNGFMIRYRF